MVDLKTELELLDEELRRLIPRLLVGARPKQVAEDYPVAVMELVDEAVHTTLEYYVDLAPRNRFTPRPVDDETLPDRLAASARSAVVSATDTVSLLEGSGVRAIHDASRNTLIENVRRERGRWARIPAYDACGFCRILGSRGPVYRSKHAALASHDGCGCEARIARPGMSLKRPAYMDGWDEDYKRHREAVKAAGLSLTGRDAINNIANSWNKELYATGVRSRKKPKGELREAA